MENNVQKLLRDVFEYCKHVIPSVQVTTYSEKKLYKNVQLKSYTLCSRMSVKSLWLCCLIKITPGFSLAEPLTVFIYREYPCFELILMGSS